MITLAREPDEVSRLRRLNPIERGHRDVRHDDVGPERFGCLDELAAVPHDPDEVEMGSEQAAQPLGHDEVVIGQQDARLAHPALSGKGACTTIVVPRPGCDRIDSSARMSRAHSFMLARPRPGLSLARDGSNPTPESATVRLRLPSVPASTTWARLARACLAMFRRASWAIR